MLTPTDELPLKPRPARADQRSMRTTLLGLAGALWGGAIVASGFLDRSPAPDAATAVGEAMALAIGALLLLAGARALVRHR